jgi:hypothetical protein
MTYVYKNLQTGNVYTCSSIKQKQNESDITIWIFPYNREPDISFVEKISKWEEYWYVYEVFGGGYTCLGVEKNEYPTGMCTVYSVHPTEKEANDRVKEREKEEYLDGTPTRKEIKEEVGKEIKDKYEKEISDLKERMENLERRLEEKIIKTI